MGGGGEEGRGDRYIKRKKNLPECESVEVPAEEECGGHHHHDDEGGQRVHGEHFPQLKSKKIINFFHFSTVFRYKNVENNRKYREKSPSFKKVMQLP